MYERFYGLNEHPFSLTPDPDFLFLNQNFREALDRLTSAINGRESLTVLIGDVGTGKTTLCWALLMRMPKTIRTALILNPLLSIEDLLRAIIESFKIRPTSRRAPWRVRLTNEPYGMEETSWLQTLSRKQLIGELYRFLVENVEADLSNVLVIDEAQNLPVECLEMLRILANLETSKRRLIQIILAGQLELDQKLNLPELRRLRQSISVRCSLRPLSKDDMIQYIYHRLWRAGANRSLAFGNSSLNLIFKHSGGYPRLINVICDRALMAASKRRSWSVDDGMVREALAQLGMSAKRSISFSPPARSKTVLTATTAAIILGGVFYFARPWEYLTGFANHPQPTASPSIPMRPPETETPSNQPQSTDRQSPPEATSPKTSGSNPLFFLQVHTLNSSQRADRAVAELKRKGFPAFQQIVVKSNQSHRYVVYIGPYADSAAAQDAAAALLHRDGLQSILRTDAAISD
jgi:general secretion pathway protein A